MNTFIFQAKQEFTSEEFHAEAKLAFSFLTRLIKVIFFLLIGLGLTCYITGIKTRRFVESQSQQYPYKHLDNLVERYPVINKKLAQVNNWVTYQKSQVENFYLNQVQPIVSFSKGFLNGYHNHKQTRE